MMLAIAKRRNVFLSVIMVLVLIFGGCTATTQRNTGTGAAWGTGIGAALGAGIGALTGNAGLGAAIGAGAGFLGGGLIGATMLGDDDVEKVKKLSSSGYMTLDRLDDKLDFVQVSAEGKNAIMAEARAIATQYPNAQFGFGNDGSFRHKF